MWDLELIQERASRNTSHFNRGEGCPRLGVEHRAERVGVLFHLHVVLLLGRADDHGVDLRDRLRPQPSTGAVAVPADTEVQPRMLAVLAFLAVAVLAEYPPGDTVLLFAGAIGATFALALPMGGRIAAGQTPLNRAGAVGNALHNLDHVCLGLARGIRQPK